MSKPPRISFHFQNVTLKSISVLNTEENQPTLLLNHCKKWARPWNQVYCSANIREINNVAISNKTAHLFTICIVTLSGEVTDLSPALFFAEYLLVALCVPVTDLSPALLLAEYLLVTLRASDVLGVSRLDEIWKKEIKSISDLEPEPTMPKQVLRSQSWTGAVISYIFRLWCDGSRAEK